MDIFPEILLRLEALEKHVFSGSDPAALPTVSAAQLLTPEAAPVRNNPANLQYGTLPPTQVQVAHPDAPQVQPGSAQGQPVQSPAITEPATYPAGDAASQALGHDGRTL